MTQKANLSGRLAQPIPPAASVTMNIKITIDAHGAVVIADVGGISGTGADSR
jgi:hypothetical protein